MNQYPNISYKGPTVSVNGKPDFLKKRKRALSQTDNTRLVGEDDGKRIKSGRYPISKTKDPKVKKTLSKKSVRQLFVQQHDVDVIEQAISFWDSREQLRLSKEVGGDTDAPDDIYLKTFHFCNLDRTNDRVSRNLFAQYSQVSALEELIQGQGQVITEGTVAFEETCFILWITILGRYFNTPLALETVLNSLNKNALPLNPEDRESLVGQMLEKDGKRFRHHCAYRTNTLFAKTGMTTHEMLLDVLPEAIRSMVSELAREGTLLPLSPEDMTIRLNKHYSQHIKHWVQKKLESNPSG